MVAAQKVINTCEYIYVWQSQTSWLCVYRYSCLCYNNVYTLRICVFGQCFIMSLIVPKKIYYVEKTTAYLLFFFYHFQQENCCHSYVHCYLQTSSITVTLLALEQPWIKKKKKNHNNNQPTNKKHSPNIQGHRTLFGQKLLMFVYRGY